MLKANRRFITFILGGLIFFLLNIALNLDAGVASAETTNTTLLVSVNDGADTTTCGTEAQPCASIQYAVNKAPSGSAIRVAAGTYTYRASTDICSNIVQTTAVVCVLDKTLTFQGGYTTSNWSTPQPQTNVTIIDGGNSTRAILVQHADGQPAATVTMDGFTVQNGRVQGASSGGDAATFAFGGAMRADRSTVTLRNMVFRNNQAIGGNTSSEYGGAGAGGAIAIRAGAGTSVLENITFRNNQAIGGSGANRGGFGIGGALYTFESALTGNRLVFTGNVARGGNSSGSGVSADNNNADGQGGAAAFHRNSNIVLTNITVDDNDAIGGDALNGQGGGAFGGGIWNESSTAAITGAVIHNNVARGGAGRNASPSGSVSFGGGVGIHNSTVRLAQASIIMNESVGGNGAVISGSGNGGGISSVRTVGESRTSVTNSVIADNSARMGTGSVSGGGGGGIYLRGAVGQFDHITLARNSIAEYMQGSGLVILNSVLQAAAGFSYSIVAQHTEPIGAAALHAQPGASVILQTGLFDGNDTNQGGGGTFTGLATMQSGAARFRSPGAPYYDYHIEETSAARNKAVGSAEARDIDNEDRDSLPDLGADEYDVPLITALYAVTTSNGTVRVFWDSQGSAIERYEVIIFCPRGASAPNEAVCGTPLDVGLQQEVLFTGLTNGVEYNIEVWAYGSGDVEVHSRSATFTVADHFTFLPYATNN